MPDTFLGGAILSVSLGFGRSFGFLSCQALIHFERFSRRLADLSGYLVNAPKAQGLNSPATPWDHVPRQLLRR